jgi:hypothetical protein
MPVRVRLSDGRVITVTDTDDPDEAVRAAERWQRRNPIQPSYRETYERRTRERAPQGAPGSLLRHLENFNRGPLEYLPQMFRNMGVADEAAGGVEFLRSGGNPEAARAGADWERAQQQRVAREQPGVNAASIAASVPAFAGNPASLASYPLAIARSPTVLEGGLASVGVNAPFALARQEGSLTERAPGALQESALSLALGGGAQGLANTLPRAPRLPYGPLLAHGEFEAALPVPAWSLPANLFGARSTAQQADQPPRPPSLFPMRRRRQREWDEYGRPVEP